MCGTVSVYAPPPCTGGKGGSTWDSDEGLTSAHEQQVWKIVNDHATFQSDLHSACSGLSPGEKGVLPFFSRDICHRAEAFQRSDDGLVRHMVRQPVKLYVYFFLVWVNDEASFAFHGDFLKTKELVPSSCGTESHGP